MVDGSGVMVDGEDGRPKTVAERRRSVTSADGAAHAGGKQPGFRIVGDYRVIQIAGRKSINLAKKHKTRAVLGFIHRALKQAGKSEFYVEEMREAFNAQFGDDMAGKRWMSDRFREDLFKGREREFDLLFEVVERAAGLYRMKVWGWLAAFGLGAWVDWLQWGVGELGVWA